MVDEFENVPKTRLASTPERRSLRPAGIASAGVCPMCGLHSVEPRQTSDGQIRYFCSNEECGVELPHLNLKDAPDPNDLGYGDHDA